MCSRAFHRLHVRQCQADNRIGSEPRLTNLVDPEPFVGRPDQSGQMSLHILDIVELARKRIVDVDDDDFPVSLAFVKKCHDAEHLDLFDLANITELLADLTDIKRIVIPVRFRLSVDDGRVFPCLDGREEESVITARFRVRVPKRKLTPWLGKRREKNGQVACVASLT